MSPNLILALVALADLGLQYATSAQAFHGIATRMKAEGRTDLTDEELEQFLQTARDAVTRFNEARNPTTPV